MRIMRAPAPIRHKSWILLFLLTALWVSSGAAQAPEVKREIPDIAREAVRATVLVVASDKVGKEISQGSGFVISSDGKVVTNYHVVEGAASAIIKFPDGAFYLIEGMLGSDANKDIAVLKAAGKNLPFLPLADSENVQIGEQVVAIGSPLSLEGTVSEGIISGRREWKERNLTVLQTTAPISPGSSGGPLLNLKGEVIGVTTFRLAGGQNLNFAVPVSYVIPLLANDTLKPLAVVTSARLDDIQGTYVGIWQSDQGASGVAAMTVEVEGEAIRAQVVVIGSPVGYKGDMLKMNVTEFGGSVWTVEFKGEHSALSGTGIFRDSTFVGDYRYRRLLKGVRDRGQWILKKE